MEGNYYRELFKTPIEEYYRKGKISIRAFNCCHYNDIDTIGDLAFYHSKKGLLSIRNCGKKVLKELEDLLEGIDLANVDLILKHQEQYEFVPKEIKSFIENKPRQPYCESPAALYCFYCVNQKELAKRFCGLKSNDEQQYYYQTLLEICSELKNAKLTISYDFELFVIAKAILRFCNNQFSSEVERTSPSSKLRKETLIADFAARASKLSIRAKKIQEDKIPTYLQAALLFQLTRKQLEKGLSHNNYKSKKNEEIIGFIEGLKEFSIQLESLDDRELNKQIVLKKFPFLSEEQSVFVFDYDTQYGHYPMFYILRHYLTMSKDKGDVVFAMSTGMLDGRCKTLEELGEYFDLTRERIRQILVKTSNRLFRDEEWGKYSFSIVNEITRDDKLFLDIVNNEKVRLSFDSFAQICFRGFHYKIVKEKGRVYLRKGILTDIRNKSNAEKRYGKNNHII